MSPVRPLAFRFSNQVFHAAASECILETASNVKTSAGKKATAIFFKGQSYGLAEMAQKIN
jgi:hypothetical protein